MITMTVDQVQLAASRVVCRPVICKAFGSEPLMATTRLHLSMSKPSTRLGSHPLTIDWLLRLRASATSIASK